jgi:hypothetical protein
MALQRITVDTNLTHQSNNYLRPSEEVTLPDISIMVEEENLKKKVVPEAATDKPKAKAPEKVKVSRPVAKLMKYMKQERVMFFWGTVALLGGNAG